MIPTYDGPRLGESMQDVIGWAKVYFFPNGLGACVLGGKGTANIRDDEWEVRVIIGTPTSYSWHPEIAPMSRVTDAEVPHVLQCLAQLAPSPPPQRGMVHRILSKIWRY